LKEIKEKGREVVGVQCAEDYNAYVMVIDLKQKVLCNCYLSFVNFGEAGLDKLD
jgi:hypothetical protein